MTAKEIDNQQDVIIHLFSFWKGSQRVECDVLAWGLKGGADILDAFVPCLLLSCKPGKRRIS